MAGVLLKVFPDKVDSVKQVFPVLIQKVFRISSHEFQAFLFRFG
nr:MAG TPA: hypothetical protein [Caudoviricetes sp.]